MTQDLIAYWKAKLDSHRWLISPEDRAMIQQTIRSLRQSSLKEKQTRLEREMELVQTASELKARRTQ